MAKKLLFSVTKKDFEVQTFRSGGPGGQNQNKVNSGVRIIHRASGATGEARDSRHQLQNKKSAFLRLTNSKTFKTWMRAEIARRTGALAEAERAVALAMRPENLRIEYLLETV